MCKKVYSFGLHSDDRLLVFKRTLNINSPVDVNFFENEAGQYAASIILGEDDSEPLSYSALVSVYPIYHMGRGLHEIAFYIVEYDGDTEATYEYLDGRLTKPKIQVKADRKYCIGAILTLLSTILDNFRPDAIFMQACDGDLPDAALIKYYAILGVFEDYGYVVEEKEPYHGRRAWRMERMDS